ncbi:MAG TPA: glycosyltransferase [Burkholderiaceae bacterium]
MGGLENGVVNLINGMPADRFRHAVVCIEDSSDFSQRIHDKSVQVHVLQRSRIGTWRLRWRLFRLFRRLRPDVVHTRNMSGLDALLPARLAGCHTVHSEHGFDVDNLNGQARKPALLRRLHAPLVQRYLCVSRDLARIMAERWGAKAALIKQVYNGVDCDKFAPPEGKRHDLLPAALQGEGLFVVGTVGRAQAVKDQATLLRAVAAVLVRRPELRARLRVAVIGDGPLLEALRALASELGLADIAWLPGARDDVAALLQAMNLFVLPSLNEGISNTLLEAMATGLPLLATAVGGNVELLGSEGLVGATFTPGDSGTLAGMIENYIDDERLVARQAEAARARALDSFSLSTMMAAYADVYSDVSGGQAR